MRYPGSTPAVLAGAGALDGALDGAEMGEGEAPEGFGPGGAGVLTKGAGAAEGATVGPQPKPHTAPPTATALANSHDARIARS